VFAGLVNKWWTSLSSDSGQRKGHGKRKKLITFEKATKAMNEDFKNNFQSILKQRGRQASTESPENTAAVVHVKKAEM